MPFIAHFSLGLIDLGQYEVILGMEFTLFSTYLPHFVEKILYFGRDQVKEHCSRVYRWAPEGGSIDLFAR